MQDVEEERKKTEALNENLIKINKELEMFAYVASHDLQEPLRKVYSFTELLEKRYGYLFDERAKKYMNYITSGANRMQHLIRDLLRFSRVGTSERPFKRFDLNSVFDQLLQDLSLKIDEKEAKIKIDNLPAIIADRTQIIQLWQNLLGNALKFCGEDTPVIHIKAEEKENEWLFSIKDNGIGIQKEYADKIFVIFQRLHEREKYEGTGIGLALCKKIVERHNGRIWFDSEPGEGSTFYFTISRNLI
jgi:light-regulated signal transduction histidine kinase (bacteriophytochrome)